MIKGVKIKKLNKFTDERGWLMEIFRKDEDNYIPQMSYISVTKPRVVRGPHEHKHQADCFVFPGPGSFELHLWDRRKNSESYEEYFSIICGEDNPSMIIVPAGVVHGYKCISDHEALCINLPDKLYKGVDKKEEIDEIRWEEDPNSPYIIN